MRPALEAQLVVVGTDVIIATREWVRAVGEYASPVAQGMSERESMMMLKDNIERVYSALDPEFARKYWVRIAAVAMGQVVALDARKITEGPEA